MTEYSKKFRLQMVRRMVGPSRTSATALASEVGVPQPTLSRWLREAGTVAPMAKKKDSEPVAQPRPKDWTAAEKLRVVLEASQLEDGELGAFLRAEGLHEAQLAEWRNAALQALRRPAKRSRRRTPQEKRIRQLEGELHRKDKALAETAALLVLQGKVQALWGGEGASTPAKNGR